MSIIPAHFNYVRVFTSREYHTRNDKEGPWTQSYDNCLSLNDQINRWVDETHVQLTVVQSPSVAVLRDEELVREYLFSISVMYIRPSEGDEDAIQRASDSRQRSVIDADSAGSEVGRVAEPPEPKDTKETAISE